MCTAALSHHHEVFALQQCLPGKVVPVPGGTNVANVISRYEVMTNGLEVMVRSLVSSGVSIGPESDELWSGVW